MSPQIILVDTYLHLKTEVGEPAVLIAKVSGDGGSVDAGECIALVAPCLPLQVFFVSLIVGPTML